MKFNKKPLIIAMLLFSMLGTTFYLTTNVDSRTVQPSPLKATQNPFDAVVEGDINGDGKVTVLDIGLLVNHLKQFHAMDMNNDNKITIKDLNLLVEEIFGEPRKVNIP